MPVSRVPARLASALALALAAAPAQAIDFSFDAFGVPVDTVLNNTLTFGYSWRLQDRAADLIGKSNINPDVCSGAFQSCQGLFRTQTHPAVQLRDAPGMASVNFDDGNLNYGRGSVVQAPLKISQDFRFLFGNYGIFFRGIGIYDYVNHNDFSTRSPNLITAQNVEEVGITGDNQVANRYFDQVYGPGNNVRALRNGDEAREIGLRYDILDFNFFGRIPYAEGSKDLTFRIGRQTVNWGQSTVAVVNSLNQAQPVNANALFRLGFGLLEELFVPVGMIRASTEIASGLTMEAYYQFEWLPVEIPTAGSFMSFVDLGTDNQRDGVNLAFGGAADDPDFVGTPLNNPLALITPTTLTAGRNPDWEARDQGQFGVSLKYYSDSINNGTEFGFYAMNYHSKLPYASFFSTDASCARAEGNPEGINATDTRSFFETCPNLPVALTSARGQLNLLGDILSLSAQRPGVIPEFGVLDGNPLSLANALLPRPGVGESSAVPFDSARLQIEYPEDRQLFGVDFTTTFGDYSFQGELSYRPNLPLQVAVIDLAFAAFGPTLTRCHDETLGCAGSSAGIGFDRDGDIQIYDDNNFTDAEGNNPFPDTVNLIVGAAPGSARSFPNFIIPYRGGTLGENPPNSYIQGWIPGKVAQYNLGATRVLGNSENWIGADQVILIYELAATHVLNMPDFDELQIEGPSFVPTHASAGAEGSGADGSRLACSTNPTCTIGADGLRFNPFQAPRDAFATAFSWGYRIVGRISYESVLPGVSIQPLFIWSHDINGNAPGPAGNFVEGRKSFNFLLETRFDKSYAFTVAYNTFFGGGTNNVYRDRDNLGFFFKYQF
jgi:hypothetical protein